MQSLANLIGGYFEQQFADFIIQWKQQRTSIAISFTNDSIFQQQQHHHHHYHHHHHHQQQQQQQQMKIVNLFVSIGMLMMLGIDNIGSSAKQRQLF